MASFGDEWIGLNKSRLLWAQRALSKALHLAFGGRMLAKNLNDFLVMMELGITPLPIHCSKAWMHLYYKTSELQTPLKDLVQEHRQGNLGTWLSNTRSTMNKRNHEDVESLGAYLLIHKLAYELKHSNRVVRYDQYELQRMANFIHTSTTMPELTEGLQWLSILRMNAFQTVKSRRQTLLQSMNTNSLMEGTCPECDTPFWENVEEWKHILLDCEKFSSEIECSIKWSLCMLADNIRLLRLALSTCIYIHLLGGLMCFTTDEAYNIEYNRDEERFLLKNYQSYWLTCWCNGFGNIPHLSPPELGTHGYVPIANFL
ncbi:hypothetical protein O181_004371 [Austropuccinia psidii MF-1]|uniref:Uncharacterized protein n=1 Tax=Austropuccinia psidii MF-1 TaxID=1389203 RepID=A0A9Q3BFF5_9BASI|nr:hypothetical protein [Austropuccinia psidii MF-1]